MSALDAPEAADPEPAADSPPLDGVVQRHDADGRLVEAATFSTGRLHGPFRLYGADGSLRREAGYVDGLADGLATDYDDAGQKLAETNWRAGQRNGEGRLYTDGLLAQAMHWEQGRLDGPLRAYGPEGELLAVIPHRGGRLHGIAQLYDPNGRLMLEAEYVNGRRHGASVQFDMNGQAVKREEYVEGRLAGAAGSKSNRDEAAADPLRAFYAGLAQERSTKVD